MRILYFFIISLISLASCQQAPTLLPELKVADSLVWEQPDSALAILTRMPKPSPSDRLNDATWCLLYTQARDKCYLPHTSDSLINVAIRYFECRDDWRRKAQAWFYRGQVELDRKNIKEAVAYYVKAKDIWTVPMTLSLPILSIAVWAVSTVIGIYTMPRWRNCVYV